MSNTNANAVHPLWVTRFIRTKYRERSFRWALFFIIDKFLKSWYNVREIPAWIMLELIKRGMIVSKKKILKIVGWTLATMVSICLVFPLPVLLIVAIVNNRIYNSKDHIECEIENLKKDANIVSVTTKVCGLKGENKYRTTVVFDDGFKFIAHDTCREDSVLTYKIYLTQKMKDQIVDRAIYAHYNTLGIPRPPQQQLCNCGKCGHEYYGTNTDKCPKCNSNIKIYM